MGFIRDPAWQLLGPVFAVAVAILIAWLASGDQTLLFLGAIILGLAIILTLIVAADYLQSGRAIASEPIVVDGAALIKVKNQSRRPVRRCWARLATAYKEIGGTYNLPSGQALETDFQETFHGMDLYFKWRNQADNGHPRDIATEALLEIASSGILAMFVGSGEAPIRSARLMTTPEEPPLDLNADYRLEVELGADDRRTQRRFYRLTISSYNGSITFNETKALFRK